MSEEKRTLKIKWMPVPGGEYEVAQVVEQSHFGADFAETNDHEFGNNGCRFVSSTCVDLYSCTSDKFLQYETKSQDFCTSTLKDKYSGVVIVPAEFVGATKAAVIEYEETNGEGYAAVEAREKKEREEREWKEQKGHINCEECSYYEACYNCSERDLSCFMPKSDQLDTESAKIEDLEKQLAAEKEKVGEINRRVGEYFSMFDRLSVDEMIDYGKGRLSGRRYIHKILEEVENQEAPAPDKAVQEIHRQENIEKICEARAKEIASVIVSDKADALIKELERYNQVWGNGENSLSNYDNGASWGFRSALFKTKEAFGK